MSETDIDPATLVDRFASMTDSERLDFARWAVSQPSPTVAAPDWGEAYVTRSANQQAAVEAFKVLRHDGTVPSTPPWDFAFDPWFPETGWEAWIAACRMVWTMAGALAPRDMTALEELRPAFAQLDRLRHAGGSDGT